MKLAMIDACAPKGSVVAENSKSWSMDQTVAKDVGVVVFRNELREDFKIWSDGEHQNAHSCALMTVMLMYLAKDVSRKLMRENYNPWRVMKLFQPNFAKRPAISARQRHQKVFPASV